MLANNLLYLLLLYAVLDDENTLSSTTAILIAAGIMLFSAFFCPSQPRCAGTPPIPPGAPFGAPNPFATVNSLFV